MYINRNNDIERRIEEHGVRPSPVRVLVLRALESAGSPMTVQEIETVLQTVDRSSITRAMAVFQDAGLVHSISDGTAAVKYEICRASHERDHSDEHVHFHCELCGRTICMPDISVPKVQLPEGFVSKKSNFVITGICADCN